ncbi:hypothetical protein AA313_de0202554 [Arthrobotrys entomopaga]|nr:hypothetical protein AA313_de0202554 [Arthrobotrys entomopaga]
MAKIPDNATMDNDKSQETKNGDTRPFSMWAMRTPESLPDRLRPRRSNSPLVELDEPSASAENPTERRRLGGYSASMWVASANNAPQSPTLASTLGKIAAQEEILNRNLPTARRSKSDQTPTSTRELGQRYCDVGASPLVPETSRPSALPVQTQVETEITQLLEQEDLAGLESAIKTLDQYVLNLNWISELDGDLESHRLCIQEHMKSYENTLIEYIKYLEGEDGKPLGHSCCSTSRKAKMLLKEYHSYFLEEKENNETKGLLQLYSARAKCIRRAEEVSKRLQEYLGLQNITLKRFSRTTQRACLRFIWDVRRVKIRSDRLSKVLQRRVNVLKREKRFALELLNACHRLKGTQQAKQALCECDYTWIYEYWLELADPNYP